MLNCFQKFVMLFGFYAIGILSADEVKIFEIFPNEINLDDLKQPTGIYFDRISFDIAKIKDSLKMNDYKEDALEKYYYIMVFKPESSDTSNYTRNLINLQKEYKKIHKDKVIDSILVPLIINEKANSVLFQRFANKPYFDNIFKNKICSPDSLSKLNWNAMRLKLEAFNDTLMVNNFDKISFYDSERTYYHPIGLLLIKEDDQYLWYLPIGWEYRNVPGIISKKLNRTSNSNCLTMGHILGYIYNFNFSKLMYTFRCK